jgi:hypothetical protein
MHSKWPLWDFFSAHNRELLKGRDGLLAVNTFDPVCLKLVKDFLTRGLGDRSLHYKMAAEVSRGWIEDEFQTPSLFGNAESFFIHQAQDLAPDLVDQLTGAGVTGRFIVLSFENELAGWKRLVKEGKVPTLVIEPPKFWETGKLLDFVCAHLRLPLAHEAKTWILDALENNLTTFYNAACLVKLNYPDAREVSLADVRELLTLERLDQFQLASLFARRKFPEFFEKLVALEGDFDKLRGFFMFMQSHLVKMADPTYLGQKPRLTQYDKELQSTARLWKEADLLREVERFSGWELLCKKKDPQVWRLVKTAALRCHAVESGR